MKTLQDISHTQRPSFTSRVVPVIVITKPAQAVPLAEEGASPLLSGYAR